MHDPTRRYRTYALALLVACYVLNFVDRQILTILAGPIAAELHLSDAELGLLTGPAFALLYTTAGFPIARWADVGVRRSIISLAVFIWSAMTAASALAQNLAHLVLARVGVGIGEAGCTPPAHSLISDLFPAERRATALAVYALGIPVGAALGNLLGGWLAQRYGWRTAFVAVGLPGLLVALLVRTTLREPNRTRPLQRLPAREVLGFMLRLRSFAHMSAGAALFGLTGYGTAAFIPVFLMRAHDFELAALGRWLGVTGLLAGGLGTLLGGWLSDRLAGLEPRWYVRLPALSSLLGVPFACLFYLWPEGRPAVLLAMPWTFLGSMYLGPTFAMTQSLVRPDMRALASALLLFIINAVGLGIGPWLVGALSDALEPRFASDSIRYASLGTAVVGTCWASLHYLLAGRTLAQDLLAKDAA